MHSTFTATVFTFLLSATSATPLVRRAMCDRDPTGADTSINPISTPSCATADICRQACEANPSCLSFVFGLPPNSDVPACRLFAVAAANVPPQDLSELHVFDRDCGDVPTAAPTHDNPRGPANSNSGNNGNGNNGNNGNGNASDNGNPNGSNGGNNGVQQGGGNNAGQGNGNNNGARQNGGGNQGGAQGGRPNKRANMCGVTPPGASGAPSPFNTREDIESLAACLALCKKTDGCKSVEFGRQAPRGPQRCMLFKVPAASLPAPGNGASLKASDVGC